MSTFEVVRGPEGDCLLLDGTRIGGPDPGCGGVSWFVFRIEEACDVVPKDEFDRLKTENTKLRELAAIQREFAKMPCSPIKCKYYDEYCGYGVDEECHYEREIYDRMCELGIEEIKED
jgi:hypothetical protein